MIKKKSGAMELSTSTIVIVVIAVLMLILGTVLVKKTMCAAIGGVNSIDDMMKKEIKDLYSDQNSNVAVKELTNEIAKGIYYGVGFGIKNEDKKANTKFSYEVKVSDLGDCKITEKEAESYIIMGKSASTNIIAGESFEDLIKFNIPKGAPLCNLKYEITVKNNGELYGTARFEVIIKKASMINSVLC
jgi:competence protein ComGC